jgi:putative FmdB family regulatory protein
MPLYEYQCLDCGEHFEKMVRISESGTSQTCPQCGSDQTHKQITTFASKNSGVSSASPSGSCAPSSSRFS